MPRRRRRVPFRQRYISRLLGGALRLMRVRVEVEGVEHVRDEPGVIVAMNHLSIMDPVLVCWVIERLVDRQVRFLAKAESLRQPVVRELITAYGAIGVDRDRPDREALRVARATLRGSRWIGLAPEGTRSRTGTMGEPKPGVALLALRSGATLLPVGIAGTERLWPIAARLPRPGTRVVLRFGEPYRPGEAERTRGGDDGQDTTRRRGRETLDLATEDLMRRIAALVPPEYRGRFG